MSSPRIRLYGVPQRMTRRFAAVVVTGQGLAIFFGALVAHAIASASGDPGASAFLWFGIVLAILCILDAGMLRRPWGVTLGWLIQAATIASAAIVAMMLLTGLVFLALWVTALYQGARMDRLSEEYAATQPAPPAALSGGDRAPASSTPPANPGAESAHDYSEGP